ncbi:MAG TPA: hypothetical protein VJ761_21960 [Ktedonobacteraceae bacterium]|nr:hypothetical protein [Ktedonobacteraceae bacterium]
MGLLHDRIVEATVQAQKADGTIIPLNEVHLRTFLFVLGHDHERVVGEGPQREPLLVVAGWVTVFDPATEPPVLDGQCYLTVQGAIAAHEARQGVVWQHYGFEPGHVQIQQVVERPCGNMIAQHTAATAVGEDGDGEMARGDKLELDLETGEIAAVLDDLLTIEEADGPAEAAPLGVPGSQESGGAHLRDQHRRKLGRAEDAPPVPRPITHEERAEGEQITGIRDQAASWSDIA